MDKKVTVHFVHSYKTLPLYSGGERAKMEQALNERGN